MSTRWSLNLQVFDPLGNPVEMAAISISKSPQPVRDIAALSGSDGQLSISVPCSGSYEITVIADGHAPGVKVVDAVSDDTIQEILLQ